MDQTSDDMHASVEGAAELHEGTADELLPQEVQQQPTGTGDVSALNCLSLQSSTDARNLQLGYHGFSTPSASPTGLKDTEMSDSE